MSLDCIFREGTVIKSGRNQLGLICAVLYYLLPGVLGAFQDMSMNEILTGKRINNSTILQIL